MCVPCQTTVGHRVCGWLLESTQDSSPDMSVGCREIFFVSCLSICVIVGVLFFRAYRLWAMTATKRTYSECNLAVIACPPPPPCLYLSRLRCLPRTHTHHQKNTHWQQLTTTTTTSMIMTMFPVLKESSSSPSSPTVLCPTLTRPSVVLILTEPLVGIDVDAPSSLLHPLHVSLHASSQVGRVQNPEAKAVVHTADDCVSVLPMSRRTWQWLLVVVSKPAAELVS